MTRSPLDTSESRTSPLDEDRDIDPQGTKEWRESLQATAREEGLGRVTFLLKELKDEADQLGVPSSEARLNTAYVNTISPEQEQRRPGDGAMERRIKSFIRWNAMAMVDRANEAHPGLGGHLATYMSAATLFEVALAHFLRAPTDEGPGDLVLFQGHASPGIYAHAFLEGRLSEEDLDGFRREVEPPGLSSYPHPRLMPHFWPLPSVSMGLSAITAIHQARIMRYLDHRGLAREGSRKVWAFLGDGEMDEPESVGALSTAARDGLDNLIFVVNCNLQRLDGPVRGDGKIIQELEALFHGVGWNVIKVIWGASWDPLLARDTDGRLKQRMLEVVDGEYQTYKARDGAYVREHFFGADPALEAMVKEYSDEELWRLKRGGHDPQKVYAAFYAASHHRGQPTVILAKTVKGYGLGAAGESQNVAHQQKKLNEEQRFAFRDRFELPLSDDQVREIAYCRPDEDSEERRYLRERREALGGSLPVRRTPEIRLSLPGLEVFERLTEGSRGREISTTMAFVRALSALTLLDDIGDRIVPIVADEARTFGMEGLFRRVSIYAPSGQRYEPPDADQIAPYKEDRAGQILQEGLSEAGAFSSWAAAGTAHVHHGAWTIPFYVFYSMFGFQRVGDLIWAAADMRARGFLVGAISGRTTLNGEGLQHEDGQSQVYASTVPCCRSYDPTYAYEIAVILHHGLERMYAEDQDEFYYLTLGNENYEHAPLPQGAEEGIRRGLYPLEGATEQDRDDSGEEGGPRVKLLGSGAILPEVRAAAALLAEEHGVQADVYSATSFNELGRDLSATLRWNRLHPEAEPRRSWVAQQLGADPAVPVVAATDFVRAFPEQIRPAVAGPYVTLGTDGFGRSDTRATLRRFFEVDRHHVVVAALQALAQQEQIAPARVTEALHAYDIETDTSAPWTR